MVLCRLALKREKTSIIYTTNDYVLLHLTGVLGLILFPINSKASLHYGTCSLCKHFSQPRLKSWPSCSLKFGKRKGLIFSLFFSLLFFFFFLFTKVHKSWSRFKSEYKAFHCSKSIPLYSRISVPRARNNNLIGKEGGGRFHFFPFRFPTPPSLSSSLLLASRPISWRGLCRNPRQRVPFQYA